jgi:predicted transcriptional regulator
MTGLGKSGLVSSLGGRMNLDVCERKHGGDSESVAAFESIREALPGRRLHVLRWIASCGDHGGTSKEYAALTGKNLNAISGRFSELKHEGLICKNGKRRNYSGVWVETEK